MSNQQQNSKSFNESIDEVLRLVQQVSQMVNELAQPANQSTSEIKISSDNSELCLKNENLNTSQNYHAIEQRKFHEKATLVISQNQANVHHVRPTQMPSISKSNSVKHPQINYKFDPLDLILFFIAYKYNSDDVSTPRSTQMSYQLLVFISPMKSLCGHIT
jgi:hypothetical protein